MRINWCYILDMREVIMVKFAIKYLIKNSLLPQKTIERYSKLLENLETVGKIETGE